MIQGLKKRVMKSASASAFLWKEREVASVSKAVPETDKRSLSRVLARELKIAARVEVLRVREHPTGAPVQVEEGLTVARVQQVRGAGKIRSLMQKRYRISSGKHRLNWPVQE